MVSNTWVLIGTELPLLIHTMRHCSTGKPRTSSVLKPDGGSTTPPAGIVTVIVAVFDVLPLLSLKVYWIVAVPENPGPGVKSTFPLLTTQVPVPVLLPWFSVIVALLIVAPLLG